MPQYDRIGKAFIQQMIAKFPCNILSFMFPELYLPLVLANFLNLNLCQLRPFPHLFQSQKAQNHNKDGESEYVCASLTLLKQPTFEFTQGHSDHATDSGQVTFLPILSDSRPPDSGVTASLHTFFSTYSSKNRSNSNNQTNIFYKNLYTQNHRIP